MKVELFKTVAVQAVGRNNTGESENALLKATALKASTLFSTLGDNKLITGGVSSGIAGSTGGDGVNSAKQNYTFGIIQNNIKTTK